MSKKNHPFIVKHVEPFVKINAARSGKVEKTQCEVIAIAPDAGASKKEGASKKVSFVLSKAFKDYLDRCGELATSHELSAASGAGCFVRFGGVRGATHLLVAGLGKDKKGYDAASKAERLRQIGGSVARKLLAEKQMSACIYLDSFLMPQASTNLDAEAGAQAFAEGFGLACYSFDKYFTKKSESKAFELTIVAADAKKQSQVERGIEMALAVVAGTNYARDLGNEPSNELTPKHLADSVREAASMLGLKFKALDEAELKKEKMGLLLGVGQGSIHPPRLIVLEYAPKAAKKAKLAAIVGKGITFDSGGISIKPSARMEDMKHDMCGAAAVIGAICTAALKKVPNHVVAVVAAAENMPSGNAIQPGNILKSRAGKTVEVTNTDAEGRLVLADALDYVQDMNPEWIIDAATLTGAISITLGKTCAGMMANNAPLVKKLRDTAFETGERVWELPMYEEYFDDLKSDYADMRNSGDTPSHGAAKGAKFLERFIRDGVRWVHLDIAAVAYNLGAIPYNPRKGASGYGVRLLSQMVEKI